MAFLPIIPVELLEQITGMIDTCDQVHLWQAGDRILSYKLKNGGLKKTSLLWSSSSWIPWPRHFFSIFTNLEELSWMPTPIQSICPSLELNLLPKTLKRLQISCADLFVHLRNQKINMNDSFPLLQAINFRGLELTEENLKNLPIHLIELIVDCPKTTIRSSTIFQDLPRTIERLELLCVIEDTMKRGNDLPTSLKYLVLTVESNFNWAPKLPKSLKSLSLNTLQDLDYTSLPPQLEELYLPCTDEDINTVLPQLPKSLTKLVLESPVPDEFMALLPPKLTQLSASGWSMRHTGLQQLPATLTDLDYDVEATHPDVLSFFNAKSKRIKLRKGEFSKQLNPFPLPSTLISLSLYFINDDLCKLLPPKLTRLTVYKGLLTVRGASLFPHSLTFLSIGLGAFDRNETIAYLSFIPKLYLSAAKMIRRECGLTEDWLSYLRPTCLLPNMTSPDNDLYVPPIGLDCEDEEHRLISLDVINQRPSMSESFLASLPRFTHLKKLCISVVFGNFYASSFRSIPPSVTELNLGILQEYPTASELAALPKVLKSLCLSIKEPLDCPWDDEIFQSLPRSLQSFTLYGTLSNVTAGLNEYLPPYLQEMSVSFGPFEHFVSPFMKGRSVRNSRENN